MRAFAKKIKTYYERGFWNESMVRDVAKKGKLTDAEVSKILGV